MNSKYNVLVNYLGDGEFKFSVKRIGEVSISKERPVFIYNADVEVINSLRTLKRMLIDITIGGKPTGAYKVFNLDDFNKERDMYNDRRVVMDRRGVETVSNNDISSILKSGSNGPIEIEEDKIVSITPTNDVNDEDIIDEVVITKPKTTTKKSTKKSTHKKTSKK